MTDEDKPKFIKALAPPDFKAVAQEGWYVYAYLRQNNGSFRIGTPYYVGIASRPNRPFERHMCPVPKDKAYVRILKSGLTRQQAASWEKTYIDKFGRKDLGIGILLNRTNGGDGSPGHIVSRHIVERIASVHRGKTISQETRRRISEARRGRPISEEQKEKIRQALTGRKHKPETIEKYRETRKGRRLADEHKARISVGLRGYIKSEEAKAKQSQTRIQNFAARAGMTVEEYINTPAFKARQRDNMRRKMRQALETNA